MMPKMTRAEFYAKYGDVQVTFSSYYKYTFKYDANLKEGKRLVVGYGGSSEQIYRHEVVANDSKTVLQLLPYVGCVYEGDAEVEDFYDYP